MLLLQQTRLPLPDHNCNLCIGMLIAAFQAGVDLAGQSVSVAVQTVMCGSWTGAWSYLRSRYPQACHGFALSMCLVEEY